MKKTTLYVALCVMLFTLCFPAQAQQPTKIHRIGWLTGSSLSFSSQMERTEAFRQGLRELGYVEGKHIVIEFRGADGNRDRRRALAAELARLKVDIIVAAGGGDTRAAKEATTTIPIVMAQSDDPVSDGFVSSLARPGGNITGLSRHSPEISGKLLELLKEIVPKLSRVAVFGTSTSPGNIKQLVETKIAAGAFGVNLQYVDVLAVRSRLPVIYEFQSNVSDGGLMCYGVNLTDLDRRAAVFVDKILKGAKAADLPVRRATKFEFIINLKAAKQIGLTIPVRVLERANQVIK